MKYKTTIELICDADNREEALNVAGEYLRGDIEHGVDLKFKASSVCSVKVKRIALGMLVMCIFAAGVLAPQFIKNKADMGSVKGAFSISTFTVQPELKTQQEKEFRKEWLNKKEKAILDYIKE